MPHSCHKYIVLAVLIALALSAYAAGPAATTDQTTVGGRSAEIAQQLQAVVGDSPALVAPTQTNRREAVLSDLASVSTGVNAVVDAMGQQIFLPPPPAPVSDPTVVTNTPPEPPKGKETPEAPGAKSQQDAGQGQQLPPPAATDQAAPAGVGKVPPGPRTVAPEVTSEANASLASHIRSLMRGGTPGKDLTGKGGAEKNAEAVPDGSTPAVPEGAPDGSTPVQTTHLPVPETTPPPAPAPVPEPKKFEGNPLDQIVNIDFRDMELTNVVAILAAKAEINAIAGTDLKGTVTANLRNVTLRQAMETCLRMNNLGMIEEEGIFRIIPYDESVQATRSTTTVKLENAKADEVKTILTDMTSTGRDKGLVTVTVNKTANVLVISAPKKRIEELVAMSKQMDVAQPVLLTVTEAIPLNYAEPEDVIKTLTKMLTPTIGQAAADKRARLVIVTDVPAVVEQVKKVIKSLDTPVKQVLIESHVIDVTLKDQADTGMNWVMNAIKHQNQRGQTIGSLKDLGLAAAMPVGLTPSTALKFGLLSGNIDWSGAIQAELTATNGRLVSSPIVMTVENQQAQISIAQEIPYVDLSQSSAGGSQTTTKFKEVGTVLKVTPQVTNDDHIICKVDGKESTTNGQFNGVPIEDKREITATMNMSSGETFFIGGLRKGNGNATIRKVPVLGDIPIINFAFRSNQRTQQTQELLVFIKCTVVHNDSLLPLTDEQKRKFEESRPPTSLDAFKEDMYDTVYPKENQTMEFKFRRTE